MPTDTWTLISKRKPPQNTPVEVCWPIVKVDDDGLLTADVERADVMISEHSPAGWLEPDLLNCLNSVAFDDDCEYALEPTHWRRIGALPDMADIQAAVKKAHEDAR